jgi:single-strand DNA-binding protein
LTVTVWDKQAEACCQYLQKGSPIFVEGVLQSRSWETPDGQKRSTIDVRAERVQFLGKFSPDKQDGGNMNTNNRAMDGMAAASSAPFEASISPDDVAWDE